MDFMNRVFWGNSLLEWSAAVLVSLFCLLLLFSLRRVLASRIGSLARRTSAVLVDDFALLIGHTKGWFLLLLGIFVGLSLVALPDRASVFLFRALMLALFVQMGLWLQFLLTRALSRRREKLLRENPAALTTIGALNFMGRLFLWTVVLLLVLDNFGFDITALVAGLGIGGVAVALAVQNVLGDLFAALSIVLDKPFTVGDFLIVDDLMGAVESVGLKSTRVRSLSGEQLIFSNSDLLNSRLRNYGRMFERRVVFKLGVTYQTVRENLKQIPGIIRAAVEAQSNVRFDRSHFMEYGAYSLNFETVYYVLSADYNQYMDIQQAIYLKIHEDFEREGIEFAYPTQTVFVDRTDNSRQES